jgi:hypothetical protein
VDPEMGCPIAATLPPGTPLAIALPLIIGVPLAAFLVAYLIRRRK